MPVAIAVGAAKLFPQLTFLDSVGALVACLFLLRAAVRILGPALSELIETGANRDMVAELEMIARSVPGVLSIHEVRTRYAGARLFVDLHIQVDGETTVRAGHAISSRVCEAIHQHAPIIIEVLVHIEPYEGAS